MNMAACYHEQLSGKTSSRGRNSHSREIKGNILNGELLSKQLLNYTFSSYAATLSFTWLT